MWIHCTFMTQLSHFTLNHVRLSVVQFVPSFYRNHTEMVKNTQKLQNIEIFTEIVLISRALLKYSQTEANFTCSISWHFKLLKEDLNSLLLMYLNDLKLA